ncbi:MAG: KOW domain-containing RNA-binding protein [Clostridia bacterium]|nr:KOW domain-containing RNA-binding protein [Clostridia bacterium]
MYQKGELVRSLRGRDKDGLLAIVDEEENAVWLADGKRRRLGSPKRKNKRHIQPAGTVLPVTAMTTDRALRRAIRQLAECGTAREKSAPDT